MGLHKKAATLLSSKDYVGALCTAGPVLKRDAADITAWYLSAAAMHGLGEEDTAIKNLRSIAIRIAELGSPVAALARMKEIEELGGKTDDLIKTLAKLYCRESERLEEIDMMPPPLPATAELEPWDEKTELAALKERGKEVLAIAWGESLASTNEASALPYIPLLSALSAKDFFRFVDALLREVYKTGDTIVAQGDIGDSMYLVAEGQVSVEWRAQDALEPRELARLGPGAFLGEMGIVSRAPRAASVVARQRTVVLQIDRPKMEELAAVDPNVGDVLIAFCHARMLENLMRVSPVLSPVPVLRRPDVISLFNTDYVESGSVIIREGEGAKGLFLVVSGGVLVTKLEDGDDMVLSRLGPGDVFGEISLIMSRPSTATVSADEDTALLVLPAADFIDATSEYPEFLKGAFDIAIAREAKNNSILANGAAIADDLILV